MTNFFRGLFYYLLNAIILKIPSWYLRKKILLVLKYKISDKSSIHVDCTILGRKLSVGKNTTINPRCLLDSRGGLSIEDSCSISREVKFISLTHDHSNPEFNLISMPIYISEGVWIGIGAIILPGVKIGKFAVIGAGAVISKDCEDYGIYIGNPGKKIGIRKTKQLIEKSYVPWFGLLT